jgi:rod shape determining protein RodA
MKFFSSKKLDVFALFCVTILLSASLLVLHSISTSIFPNYYFYIVLSAIAFFVFLHLDFDVFLVFSKHLYIFSIILLILPLIIGQVTRGAIRWIPLGPITIQPSEIVRPFLILFFAQQIMERDLNFSNLIYSLFYAVLPIFLIVIQPSLGVALLTSVGFLGVIFAADLDKKLLLRGLFVILALIPLFWLVLAPYQRDRIGSFIDPASDPQGAGYNSIQAMISVGSGGLFGRGLGEGVQTQLAFLPEKHTDFIFASTAEELGLAGVTIVLLSLFILFWRMVLIMENARSPVARAFISGVILTFLTETFIHIGMNMGLLPITGVPLPFMSAGGSALLALSISLALVMNAKRLTT